MKYSCKSVTRRLPEPFSLDDAEFIFPDGRVLRARGSNVIAARIELESGKSRFLCRKNGQYFLFTENSVAEASDDEMGTISPVSIEDAKSIFNSLPLKKPADEAFPAFARKW